MLAQVISMQLGKALKARFESEFKRLLQQAPDAVAAAAVAGQAVMVRNGGKNYTGQKGHEKKIIAFVESAMNCPFTAVQA